MHDEIYLLGPRDGVWNCSACHRKSFKLISTTIIHWFKHEPIIICISTLLWIVGIRWLGPGQFCWWRNQSTRKKHTPCHPLKHDDCYSSFFYIVQNVSNRHFHSCCFYWLTCRTLWFWIRCAYCSVCRFGILYCL